MGGIFGLIGVALGVVGAVAFLLAYGDRQRLKETIASLERTVSAYKEELSFNKEENKILHGQVGECQGAIRVLTEAVTQSAKVEMLSHVSSDQHRAILLKLEEVRLQFSGALTGFTTSVLGAIRDERLGKGSNDGTDKSSDSRR